MKKIVIIGGGSGTSTLISGLLKFTKNISVIVSAADDGGSTGKLRRELNVMPPGDIRQCLIALSNTTPATRELMKYRFDKGEMKGHVVGNILIAVLEKITGNHIDAINELSKILNVKGKVMFSSNEATHLSALYEDGTTKHSEHEIDEPENHKGGKIIKLSLSNATANLDAIRSIREADAIILGPGDLYTSVLPNLLVKGIDKAIADSKVKKILITNIMTKYGQTDNFKASDFLKVTNEYLSKEDPKARIDVVITNSKKPTEKILSLYKKEHAKFVESDIEAMKAEGAEVISSGLFSDTPYKKPNGDKLKRSFIRHDSSHTAKLIWEILK